MITEEMMNDLMMEMIIEVKNIMMIEVRKMMIRESECVMKKWRRWSVGSLNMHKFFFKKRDKSGYKIIIIIYLFNFHLLYTLNKKPMHITNKVIFSVCEVEVNGLLSYVCSISCSVYYLSIFAPEITYRRPLDVKVNKNSTVLTINMY